jgi:hypothetical protein
VSEKNILPEDFLKRAWAYAALIVGTLALSCTRSSLSPAEFAPQAHYTLSFFTLDSVHVSATFAPDRDIGLQKILFPPFDADNPRLAFYGNNIHGIKVTGATIEAPLAQGAWAGDSVQTLLVRTIQGSYVVEYDVTFPYGPNGNTGMRTVLPGAVGAIEGYYQGNYCFCVPSAAETKTGLWRSALNAHVTMTPPDNGKLYGVPAGVFDVHTPYELMFLQFAVSDRAQQCNSSLSNFVVLSSREPEPVFASSVCADLKKTLDLCAGLFPAQPGTPVVFFQDSGSGMEGTFSFYMQNWAAHDYTNAVRYVTPHEALHWWVGIRTGDIDDPWWKEATAEYLGFVLSCSMGFSKDTLRPQLVRDLSANPMVPVKALSDPYVRNSLFLSDTTMNCVMLVYYKGAQVNMILDKMLRRATNNTVTLFSKTGDLCTRYDHAGFSRQEFKAILELGTGLDLSDFFAQYVDSPGVLDTAMLSQTFAWLDSCGAFTGKP